MKELWFLWFMSTVNVEVQMPEAGFASEAECKAHLNAIVFSASHYVENGGVYQYKIWGDCVAVPQVTED